MKRYESMPLSEWLAGKEFKNKPKVRLVRKYTIIAVTVFATVLIFQDGTNFALAISGSNSSGIEVGGRELYSRLVSVGKWIIMAKGGFETLKHVTNSDYEGAKKVGISHLVIFALLIGMPYAFDMIEELFSSFGSS